MDTLTVDSPVAEERAAAVRRRTRVQWWRGVVLGAVAIYFLVPLFAAIRYSLTGDTGHFTFSALSGITSKPGFTSAVTLSLRLMAVTLVISLVLVVPTAVYVHLRRPALRRVMDSITFLPIVIPPVVLIVGVLDMAPTRLKSSPYLLALEYVVLAWPFMYRSLSTGLSAIDLRTLVEAGRSLGAGWWATIVRVVVPNLRAALLSATVLTVAVVLGEFTMASLDQYQTFPVWVVNFEQDNSHVSTAVSFLALLLTWAMLLAISGLDRRRRSASGVLSPSAKGRPWFSTGCAVPSAKPRPSMGSAWTWLLVS
jgi:putative spermidine/putrescine transport system permease protein